MDEGRQRGRWPGVAVAAAVLALVAGAGIIAVVRPDPSTGPGARVVVLGDSVTHQSTADLLDALDGLGEVQVRGRSGLRTDELLGDARELLAEEPDVAVFLPGYNDVWQHADTDAAVAEMVGLAARAPCAVWMLLPTKGDWPPARMEAFNARVEELAAAHPSIHVDGGWRDRADAAPGPAPDPELVSDDLVHPTRAGTRAIAEAVAAAVRRACP